MKYFITLITLFIFCFINTVIYAADTFSDADISSYNDQFYNHEFSSNANLNDLTDKISIFAKDSGFLSFHNEAHYVRCTNKKYDIGVVFISVYIYKYKKYLINNFYSFVKLRIKNKYIDLGVTKTALLSSKEGMGAKAENPYVFYGYYLPNKAIAKHKSPFNGRIFLGIKSNGVIAKNQTINLPASCYVTANDIS